MLWTMHQVKTFCKSCARYSKFLLSLCFIFFVLSQWYLLYSSQLVRLREHCFQFWLSVAHEQSETSTTCYLLTILYYSENNWNLTKNEKKMLTYVDKLFTFYEQLWQNVTLLICYDSHFQKSRDKVRRCTLWQEKLYDILKYTCEHLKVHLRTS